MITMLTMDMTRYLIAGIVLAIVLFSMTSCVKPEDMLAIGSQAPDFELPDQDAKLHKLSDYKGKNVLIYFYPKDATPGCTAEACAIRDSYDELLAQDLVIFGVSADTVESHKKFAEDHKLPFSLLADPKKEVVRAYKANGKLFVSRISYLINKEGKISHQYPNVSPLDHASEIVSDLNDGV